MGRFWPWRGASASPVRQIHGERKPSGLMFSRGGEEEFPQNLDPPRYRPPYQRKPYPRPLDLVIWEYERHKRLGSRLFWKAPRNGMLVEHLIPLAHEVVKEYAVLEEGVARLMKSIPVKACTCCMDIHIGRVGHQIPTCRGTDCRARFGMHQWIRGYVEDVLVPVEAYHIYDRLGPPLTHDDRYTVPRVPAIHELCMQAGVDDPRYPIIRWARRSGRQVGNGFAQVPLSRFHNAIIPGYSDDESEEEEEEEEEADDPKSGDEQENATETRGSQAVETDEAGSVSCNELQRQRMFAAKEVFEDVTDTGVKPESEGATREATRKLDIANKLAVEKMLRHDVILQKELKLKLNLEDVDQLDLGPLEDPTKPRKKWAELAGSWRLTEPTEAEKQELKAVAERTLVAFDNVRKGVQVLLNKFRVWTCGYCPEVHMAWKPHQVRLCGGGNKNIRRGKHTWQEASLSDVFPPNFVWHVPPGHDPKLTSNLRKLYGQTPAVVELCVQAGAEPPARWKPFMKTDVVLPEESELIWVA